MSSVDEKLGLHRLYNLTVLHVTNNTLLSSLGVILLVVSISRLLRIGRREQGLPPGPPTVPLLGNLHQIPKSGAHFQFQKWAQEYGRVFSLKLGAGTMIVLNDREAVRALLDAKGSVYSDRPDMYVVQDIITGGNHLLPMKYGDKWRRVHKLLHGHFHEARCNEKHLPVIEAEAAQMMHEFLVDPEHFMSHPKRFTNSILMSQVYGIRTPTARTKHMLDLFAMIEKWAEVGETGATPPVDLVPLFKYLPESLWGKWKSRAATVGAAMDRLYGGMIDQAKVRRQRGELLGAIVDDVLDQQPKMQRERGELNFSCGVMIEAGSDTSASMILAAIHAMTAYPEVQRKAQIELDRVIPAGRSPSWQDYDNLPYTACVVKETMRWRPTAPLAFPHANIEDDVYNGMMIPKDSIIVLNTWSLHHDLANLSSSSSSSPPPAPDVFEPERFAGKTRPAAEYINCANPEQRDHYGYGAGRRACPGIHLAERMLFVGVAKLLWAFSFQPDIDPATGTPAHINVDFATAYTHGFVHCPKDFPAKVTVRSEDKRKVIQSELSAADCNIFSRFKVPTN